MRNVYSKYEILQRVNTVSVLKITSRQNGIFYGNIMCDNYRNNYSTVDLFIAIAKETRTLVTRKEDICITVKNNLFSILSNRNASKEDFSLFRFVPLFNLIISLRGIKPYQKTTSKSKVTLI